MSLSNYKAGSRTCDPAFFVFWGFNLTDTLTHKETEAVSDVSRAIALCALALGGPGSGNWGHASIPGKRGGSAKRGVAVSIKSAKDWRARYKAKTGREPRAPKEEKAAGKGFVEGRESIAFGNDPNKKYKLVTRVVPLSSLIPSNTMSGSINPDYDKTLQPRQRSRQASQQQIDNVARNLVPESLLMDFHALDKGAPIVGDDGMVESGNGRTLALMRARDQYPEKWAEYQAKLKQQLDEQGIDAKEAEGIENPVLVRVREDKNIDRAAFAKEANQAAVLQMSPLEQAKVDAQLVKTDSLSNFQIKDGQSIDQALRTRANAPFVKKFVGGLPKNEAAVLQRADGTLNRMGIWRMKAAIFSKIFPGDAGDRLADTFLESLDSGIKNFENAIGDIMPKLARAESMIASGERGKGLSLSRDFSKAIDMLARLKESGMPVRDYLRQGSLFERELSTRQERLLSGFDKVSRSRKQIREMLERYADKIIEAPDTRQGGLFGGEQLTEEQILFAVLQGLE